MHELLTPTDLSDAQGDGAATQSKIAGGGLFNNPNGLLSNIGIEELLLLGVIILLITEGADIELILVLGFLLFVGL